MSAFSLFEKYANTKLSDLPFNDFELDYDTVSMSFSNVYSGSNVQVQISDMIFTSPGSINVFIASFATTLFFDFKAAYATQTLTGTGNMTVSSNDLSFSFSILNNNGSPMLDVQDLDLSLNSFLLSTTLSSAQNTEVMNYMNSGLQSIEYRLTQYISNEINKFNAGLVVLPKMFPLAYWDVWVDMSLSGNSLIESDYFVLPFMGAVLDGDLEPVIPFISEPMLEMQSGEDFQAQFSDYFLTSVGTAIWSNFNETVNSLPAGLPIQLTTVGLKGLVPKLAHKYGRNKAVYLQVSMSGIWPEVTVRTAKAVTVTFGMLTQVFVERLLGEDYELAVEINTLFEVNFNFTLKSQAGSVAVNYIKTLDNVLGYTTVGNIPKRTLNKEMVKIIAGSMTIINNIVKNFKVQLPVIDYFIVTADSIAVMNGTTVYQANLTPN